MMYERKANSGKDKLLFKVPNKISRAGKYNGRNDKFPRGFQQQTQTYRRHNQ